MKKMIRYIALVLSLVFLFSISASATSNEPLTDEERSEQIVALLQQRQDLLLANSDDVVTLSSIDAALADLGVDFLSYEEVEESFPEAAEAFAVETEDATKGNSPRWITKPTTNKDTWASWFVETTYNGTRYKVQQIVVMPKNINSVLWNTYNETITYNSSCSLSTTLFRVMSSEPYTEIYKNYTYTIGDIYTQLSGVTSLTVHSVNYSVVNKENIIFSYVAPVSNQDDFHYSHISNLFYKEVTTSMVATYKKPNQAQQSNVALTNTQTVTARQDYYNDADRACLAYYCWINDPTFYKFNDYIKFIYIYGLSSEQIVLFAAYDPDSIQTVINNSN